ncbi:unnamed protein product [Tilletia controversa]|nr:unnamed protein product [Tilletia controversa]
MARTTAAPPQRSIGLAGVTIMKGIRDPFLVHLPVSAAAVHPEQTMSTHGPAEGATRPARLVNLHLHHRRHSRSSAKKSSHVHQNNVAHEQ